MSTTGKNVKVETLAWITDDEAEFWTSTSPMEKKHGVTNHLLTKKKNKPAADSASDGLYFKKNDELKPEVEDHLSLLHEKTLAEKEKADEVKNDPVRIPFQPNENIQLDESNPQKNMSFFDRLLHQLTRPSTSEIDYIDDEVFEEVDENEIKHITNNHNSIKKADNDGTMTDDNISIFNTIRSFIDEVTEETNVIIGNMDEETLVNRRSRKAKSEFSSSIKSSETS